MGAAGPTPQRIAVRHPRITREKLERAAQGCGMRQREFDELAESIRQAGKINCCQIAASRELSLAMIDWRTCPGVEQTPDQPLSGGR